LALVVPPLRKRVRKALVGLVINAVLWIAVPYYIGSYLAKAIPSTPLSIPTFVYEFGAVIIALEVIIALTQGMALQVPFVSGLALFSAYYLWVVTDGGNLSVIAGGVSVLLQFQPIVYVMILPSIWAAIRAPLAYAIWRRAPRMQTIPTA
jgi:hypothetical protein